MIFTLELLMLSTLLAMHHTLHIKNICKLLIRVEGRMQWLEGFDGARRIDMVSLFQLASLVHIPDVDV